jgi:UDP-xylose/UDP-N-acetylglucosamine transporter B4
MISILYFQNPFTPGHWLGTALVFVGTIMFTNIIKKIFDAVTATHNKKTQ